MRGVNRMTRRKDKNGLTIQEEKFCQVYFKTGNGKKAILEAYPTSKNWKENSIFTQVVKTLDKPHIQARLEMLQKECTKSLKISTNKLLTRLVEIAEECNTPAERQHALTALKMLLSTTDLVKTGQNNINVNIQNNTITAKVDDYLGL